MNKKRLTPGDKHNTRWWQKRNEARSVLQAQYAKAKERAEAEAEAAKAILGAA